LSETPYSPDRRPVPARERRASKQLAEWMAKRGVSPNAISLAGMCAGVAAGGALALTSWSSLWRLDFLAAALLMQLRLVANMLDGMVAIATQKASPVGELYNEVPDRVSDAAIFIGAGYATGGNPELGYLAACLAIFIAYIRAEGKVAGAHQEFCGPMAKPQRMFVLTVASLYCGLAPQEWQPVPATLPGWGVMAASLILILVGGLWTVVRRLVRVARAIRSGHP